MEVGRGRGADVMGHPFEALAWLANSLAQRGRSLRAGEFVFTGSVVETKWVNRGDRVVMEIEGLGRWKRCSTKAFLSAEARLCGYPQAVDEKRAASSRSPPFRVEAANRSSS